MQLSLYMLPSKLSWSLEGLHLGRMIQCPARSTWNCTVYVPFPLSAVRAFHTPLPATSSSLCGEVTTYALRGCSNMSTEEQRCVCN